MRRLLAVFALLLVLAPSGRAQEGSGLVVLPNLNSTAPDHSPDISGDGRLIVFYSTRPGGAGREDVYLYDRERQGFVLLPGLNSPGPDFSPTLNANGSYIAFASVRTSGEGGADIYLYDLATRTLVTLPNLNTPAEESFPVISADGRFILYRFAIPGQLDLYLYDREARARVPLPAVNTSDQEDNGELSDDARFVAFFRERGLEFLGDFLFDRQTEQLQRHGLRVTDLGADGRLMVILDATDLHLYDRDAGRLIPLPGLNSPTFENAGRLSQDGRFIVFTSFRNGLTNPDIFLYRRGP